MQVFHKGLHDHAGDGVAGACCQTLLHQMAVCGGRSTASPSQSTEAMGQEMARLLIARIRGEAVDDPVVILDTHLVIRESA
ncbi:MAG: hypothetical protein ACRDOO_20215 [Actinomadura sp.]